MPLLWADSWTDLPPPQRLLFAQLRPAMSAELGTDAPAEVGAAHRAAPVDKGEDEHAYYHAEQERAHDVHVHIRPLSKDQANHCENGGHNGEILALLPFAKLRDDVWIVFIFHDH